MARPYRPVRYRTKTLAKIEKFSEQPYTFGRGENYYEDVPLRGSYSTVTSGTEGGPGGGTSSTRQSDIEMIGPTAESVYGAGDQRRRKQQSKAPSLTFTTNVSHAGMRLKGPSVGDSDLDSRGRSITKL